MAKTSKRTVQNLQNQAKRAEIDAKIKKIDGQLVTAKVTDPVKAAKLRYERAALNRVCRCFPSYCSTWASLPVA